MVIKAMVIDGYFDNFITSWGSEAYMDALFEFEDGETEIAIHSDSRIEYRGLSSRLAGFYEFYCLRTFNEGTDEEEGAAEYIFLRADRLVSVRLFEDYSKMFEHDSHS